MRETAVTYYDNYPNKRLIVHFFQPHGPYFTEGGEERYRFPAETKASCDPTEFREAYVSNLRLVLSETKRLLESLEGKTVITSDHGELLGERLPPFPVRQYQHPPGVYIEPLVNVPWLVIDDGDRKTIVEERNPNDWSTEAPQTDDLDEQLEALGYR